MHVSGRNETGMLLNALKDMNESLQKIVTNVRTTTDELGAASQQIVSGNSDLSRRTEAQAASLEETASSMEEVASTVQQNTESAVRANELAANASAVASKGGQVVGEVVKTMSSINQASMRVVDIIGVIDGIAFQTNILALNAAVEAARAGDQGRGFAVVATGYAASRKGAPRQRRRSRRSSRTPPIRCRTERSSSARPARRWRKSSFR